MIIILISRNTHNEIRQIFKTLNSLSCIKIQKGYYLKKRVKMKEENIFKFQKEKCL